MKTRQLYPRKPRVTAASKTLERSAQKAIVEWLELVLPKGSRLWATVNENMARSPNAHSRARYMEKMRTFGVRAGAPDLTIALPNGRTVYIEMKRPVGGVISAEQQRMHADLIAGQHAVGVCVDIESARAFLQDEGVVLNEAAGQLARRATVRSAVRKDRLNDPLPF